MSTVNVQPTTSARAAVTYALLGTGKRRAQHTADGTTRAAALSCSLRSVEELILRAELVSAALGRRNEMYTYTQNFSPEEFDVRNPEHVQRVHELGVMLAKRMNTADHLVVTHTDSAGGHVHNHIYVINHDNLTGKALTRCRSWSRGLRQVNDELMRDEGCQVLPSPEAPKPDWDLRRGAFKDGGFEQVLGDKIAEALMDARSVDRGAFEEVLAEHEVRLRVTDRDGWTYSMRRADNGKWGRRKASSLCDEFTASGVQPIFEYHAKKMKHNPRMKGNHNGASRTDEGARRLGRIYGDLTQLDLEVRQRRAASIQAHKAHLGSDGLHEERRREYGNTTGESVNLASKRAALDRVRRDAEQAERDREDDRRRLRNAHRITTRDTPQRHDHTISRFSGLQLDAGNQQPAQDDGFEL
ncbi:relaxase/mobilization nuclease domain-containing protein [Actinomyces sp. ZJ308]|uniref:relaxase/mobilization nuclease domain-containing protein n=1 Tax=Actinomyces sp. ZJ308 TaxID=2708342 RepID=UPI001421A503|nr:relaxase/mobilization nuclease domain-containing protein [Actinomyces sp. ZJ308]